MKAVSRLFINKDVVMVITLDVLQQRRDDLTDLKARLDIDLEMSVERNKVLRKEIANTKGAIIEIDRLIEAHD